MSYYDDKLHTLREMFGDATAHFAGDEFVAGGKRYPVIDDVILTLDPDNWPAALTRRRDLQGRGHHSSRVDFAEDIQHTFGEEWKTFSEILPEHEATFRAYFSQIDLASLQCARLCDLGCGMGRWSAFVAPYCRELVLVDFSEAIFVARKNLADCPNAIFVMADIRRLPFAHDFADMIFTLGVLHHLPTPVLEEVVRLKPYARRLLVYLYYALDNKPLHFRMALAAVTPVRLALARIRNSFARSAITTMIALLVYKPLVGLGHLLRPIGGDRFVPLHEGYRGRSLKAVKQDAYDRFFTRIEQRVTRREIEALRSQFSAVEVSPDFPFWHFTCDR